VTDTGPAASALAAGGDAVARLWLATLHDVVGRVAHDVKNLLNGVAVNLEVVRSRSSRQGADVAAVRPFADSAAQQFDRLAAVTDALLVLARPAREPVNVVDSWNSVAVLAVPAAATGGDGDAGGWRAQPPTDGSEAVASAPGEPVRLALAAAAVAAGGCGGGQVTCRVSRSGRRGRGDSEIRVAVSCAVAEAAPRLRDGVADAVAPAGIRVGREENVLIVTIPAVAAPMLA
jgi:hypothetical protein